MQAEIKSNVVYYFNEQREIVLCYLLCPKRHTWLCVTMYDAVIGLMVLYGILRPFWFECYVHVKRKLFHASEHTSFIITRLHFVKFRDIDEIFFSLYFIRYGSVHVTCNVYALSNAQCLYNFIIIASDIIFSSHSTITFSGL